MRKYLIILLLSLSAVANSQVDYFVITSGSGYPSANGILMGGLEHLAPANPYGHKEGWIIYVHGIDHKARRPTSVNDTTQIAVLTNKGVPKLVKNNPLPLFQKPGGLSTDLYRWNVIAMQCSDEFSTIPLAYTAEAIKRIKTLYAATTDTNKIMIVGYSWGGQHVGSHMDDSRLRNDISYCVMIGAGTPFSADHTIMANEGYAFEIFHSKSDALALVGPIDSYVNARNAANPLKPINYYRFNDLTGTDHDRILIDVAEDTTAGDTHLMSNGDMWTRDETIFHRGLRYTKQRAKR